MVQVVPADCLAALMVLDRELEVAPEPFRLQPDLQLIVDFEEYLRFVDTLPSGCKLLAHTPEMIRRQPLQSFYMDMAFAVGKELSFATRLRREATIIQHRVRDCQEVTQVSPPVTYSTNLHLLLMRKGFYIELSRSRHNDVLWDYAVRLYYTACCWRKE